jgi:hypothetical protein
MSKRNAIRIGPDPHAAESVAYAVKRYGPIKLETLAALVDYLDSPEGKAERTYEIIYETMTDFADDGEGILRFPTIKTIRKGSAIYKIIDNEHDAQNTLTNIHNADFPRNKQGV